MTGLSRQEAAEAVASLFDTTARHSSSSRTYDPWEITDNEGKIWRFVYDSSIHATHQVGRQQIPIDDGTYKVEMNSPKLEYREMGKLQEVVRVLRHAGAVVNQSCGMRITYKATVNSSADTVYGDNGNPNDVVLTWKRTNTTYYDTLEDDCHFYVYGLDLLKQFSDGKGDFKNVQFKLYNNTDKYWVTAELNETEGIYYVKDQADKEADATTFIPVSTGALTVKGLEDDEYIITEIATDDGYTLLKDSITVVITSAESGVICDVCGKSGITATATVNGDAVGMIEDNGSVSAIVPMSVINTLGFDLPQTGENGTWLFAVGGVLIVSLSAAFIFFILAKKRKTDEQ